MNLDPAWECTETLKCGWCNRYVRVTRFYDEEGRVIDSDGGMVFDGETVCDRCLAEDRARSELEMN